MANGFQLVKLLDSAVVINVGGFTPRGVYDNATTYNTGDLVEYLGASYLAKGTTTGNLPTDTAFWQIVLDPPVDSVNGQIGDVVLDPDDLDDTLTTNKFITAGQLAEIAANTLKVSADGSIDTHSNVDLTGLADDNVLQYNLATGNFEPVSADSLQLTASEVKALYESNPDTNPFTDAEQTKLAGIESGATGDQTGAEIKALYEAEPDTNAFTDAEQIKLASIESGATGDQNASEVPVTPSGNLTSTNVQSALVELQTDLDNTISQDVLKQQFEYVSKNIPSNNSNFAYNPDGTLNTITYTSGLIKTFSYTSGILTTIVLSGTLPSGITATTKTLVYDVDGNVDQITYS